MVYDPLCAAASVSRVPVAPEVALPFACPLDAKESTDRRHRRYRFARTLGVCYTRTVQPIVGLPVGAIPQSIELGSFKTTLVQTVHQKDGRATARTARRPGSST